MWACSVTAASNNVGSIPRWFGRVCGVPQIPKSISDTWSHFIGGSRELSRVNLVHIGFVPFNNVIYIYFHPELVEALFSKATLYIYYKSYLLFLLMIKQTNKTPNSPAWSQTRIPCETTRTIVPQHLDLEQTFAPLRESNIAARHSPATPPNLTKK